MRTNNTMDNQLVKMSAATFPFEIGGEMTFQCWRHGTTQFVALLAGNVRGKLVHMRVHDACLTSEVFGSCKCDCRHQLHAAQRHIGERAKAGSGGIIVYTFQVTRYQMQVSPHEHWWPTIDGFAEVNIHSNFPSNVPLCPPSQEGRGIGLANKIAAYDLQQRLGLDTVEANEALGLPAENRDYAFVPPLLASLGVESVVLLTNNPFKVARLEGLGVAVAGRHAVLAEGLPAPAAAYVRVKGDRMGHLLGGAGPEKGAAPTSDVGAECGAGGGEIVPHRVLAEAPCPLEPGRSRL